MQLKIKIQDRELIIDDAQHLGGPLAGAAKYEVSKSKIKKLPTVDVQKMDSIEKALETHCHEDRLEQGYAALVKSREDEDPKKIGEFIRWVVNDIWEEEGDALVASDISRKDMGAAVSKKAARWFQSKLQSTI